MAILLNGKKLSQLIAEDLKKKISLESQVKTLVIIQIGDVAESNIYIDRKKKFGAHIGVTVIHKQYEETVSEDTVISDIQIYNTDTSVHGIILQLPIPDHIDKNKIIESILPNKDVDGLTATNVKHLYTDDAKGFIPATTRGIISLLEHHDISISGKKVVIVGRSTLVSKPTALLCVSKDATVTICHSKTKNLQDETKKADILIVATGHKHLITKEYVSEQQVIIDVGINALEDVDGERSIVGDVDFEHIKDTAYAITPVPGGVGPMTVASLFQNVVEGYER